MKLDKSEFPLDNDKPCPFCANNDVVCEGIGEEWVCWCRNCGAFGPNSLSWLGAIKMWNMRRPYHLLEAENEKLLEAIKDLEELFEKECKK